jgi:hypothetical protein
VEQGEPADVGGGRGGDWRGAESGEDVAGPGAVGGGGWLVGGATEAPGAEFLDRLVIRGGCGWGAGFSVADGGFSAEK